MKRSILGIGPITQNLLLLYLSSMAFLLFSSNRSQAQSASSYVFSAVQGSYSEVTATINSIGVVNVAPTITTNGGTLPMTASIFPAIANQAVTWSVVPIMGSASISATGVVTAQNNGTVWAKAVSVANTAKMDSLLITISNQTVPPVTTDSVDLRTVGRLLPV